MGKIYIKEIALQLRGLYLDIGGRSTAVYPQGLLEGPSRPFHFLERGNILASALFHFSCKVQVIEVTVPYFYRWGIKDEKLFF